MLETVEQEILELKEKLRQHNKLQSLRKSKSEELSKKKAQKKELKKILEKERKDVEKLESLSLSSVFSTLIGRKVEKLDKEKEEYLVAKLKYEDFTGKIKELEEELDRIKKILWDYGDIDKRYGELIKEKEALIIEEGGMVGKQLRDKTQEIDEFKIDIKEIREAIGAGESTLYSLEKVKEKLQSAKNWGTWDMLGGGLISNIGKHSAISDANDIAADVKYHLQSFKKELSDVNEFTDIQVNISSFASFADFFLDGIFADWFVQTKINDSLSNVNRTIERIEMIITDLNRNLKNLEIRLKKSEAEVKDILKL